MAKIYERLEVGAVGMSVTGAKDVIDDDLNIKQSEINKKLTEGYILKDGVWVPNTGGEGGSSGSNCECSFDVEEGTQIFDSGKSCTIKNSKGATLYPVTVTNLVYDGNTPLSETLNKLKDAIDTSTGADKMGYKPLNGSIYSETCDNVNTALNEISDNILGISTKESYHAVVSKKNDELYQGVVYKAVVKFQPAIPAGTPVSIRVIDGNNYTSQYLNFTIAEPNGTLRSWNKNSVNKPIGEGLTFDYAISAIDIQTYYKNSITVEVEYDSERYLLPVKVEELETNLGDLNSLTTEDKSSVVGAVNSVNVLLSKNYKSEVIFENVAGVAATTAKEIPTPVIPSGGQFKFTCTNLDGSSVYAQIYLANESEEWLVYSKTPNGEKGSLDATTTKRVTKVVFYAYSTHKLSCEVDYLILALEDNIAELNAHLGDINSLTTDDKSSVVNAVNSISSFFARQYEAKTLFTDIPGTTFNTAKEIETPVMPIGGQFKFTCTNLDGSSVYAQIYLANESEEWLVYSKTPNGEKGSLDATTTKRVTKVVFYAYSTHKLSCDAEYASLVVDNNIAELNAHLGDIAALNTDDTSSVVGAVNSIVRALPEMNDETVYDVVRGSGKGVGTAVDYEVSIKKGTQVIINQSGTGDYKYYIITAKNSTTGESQTLLYSIGGNVTKGGWDVPIEVNIDVDTIGLESYPATSITITHTQRALAVETEVKSKVNNRWYGRKWLLVGDSISTEREYYATSGYGDRVSKSLGLVKTNISHSGKVMAWGYDVIDSYNDHYDLITVMLGTNNHGYNTGLGSLNDDVYQSGDYKSNNSFYAVTQLFYEKLHAKWPKSVIAFITPIKRANPTGSGGGENEPGGDSLTNVGGYNTNALGLTTESYADVIKEVCKWYSIPCIDIFNTIDPRTEDNRKKYFMSATDGTHPNDFGHAMCIAPVVEAELVKCAPYWDVVDTWEFPVEEDTNTE